MAAAAGAPAARVAARWGTRNDGQFSPPCTPSSTSRRRFRCVRPFVRCSLTVVLALPHASLLSEPKAGRVYLGGWACSVIVAAATRHLSVHEGEVVFVLCAVVDVVSSQRLLAGSPMSVCPSIHPSVRACVRAPAPTPTPAPAPGLATLQARCFEEQYNADMAAVNGTLVAYRRLLSEYGRRSHMVGLTRR